MNEPVQIINERILSKNRYLLKEITVQYTDSKGASHTTKREVYERGDAAAAVLYNPAKGTVILLNQFRLPTFLNGNPSGILKETCAGMLDGDSPEACVRREILEESGYEVLEVAAVGDMYVSPAGSTERIYLFVAPYTQDMKINTGGGLAEEQEYIEIEELSFHTALQLIADRKIQDAKTIVLLYHLRVHGLM